MVDNEIKVLHVLSKYYIDIYIYLFIYLRLVEVHASFSYKQSNKINNIPKLIILSKRNVCILLDFHFPYFVQLEI